MRVVCCVLRVSCVLNYYSYRPAFEGLGNEIVSIHIQSFDGHKESAGLHLARVAGQAGDFHLQIALNVFLSQSCQEL